MINHNGCLWIYNDEGVSEVSVQSAIATFKHKLPNASISAIRTISSQQILAGDLNERGCLVIPGGADLPYCNKLNGQGNDIIRKFVAEGNIYIGICAGGYYGAQDIEFAGAGCNIEGPRELAFFKGRAIGSIDTLTGGQLYDETTASKAMVKLSYQNGHSDWLYYHGGAHFVSDFASNTSLNTMPYGSRYNIEDAETRTDSAFNIIAQYQDGTNAIVSGAFGLGRYLLSGIHFELCPDIYHRQVDTLSSHHQPNKEKKLLRLLRQPNYGKLVYRYIDAMMVDVFSAPNTSLLDSYT